MEMNSLSSFDLAETLMIQLQHYTSMMNFSNSSLRKKLLRLGCSLFTSET